MIVAVVAIVGGVVAATSSSDNDLSSPLLPIDRSSKSPTLFTPTVLAGILYPDQDQHGLSPAQYDALRWIVEEVSFLPNPAIVADELLERHALVTICFGLGGKNWVNWTEPTNWLENTSHCERDFAEYNEIVFWFRVSSVEFEYEGLLQGSLLAEIGKLSNLKELLPDGNAPTGQLPTQFYDI